MATHQPFPYACDSSNKRGAMGGNQLVIRVQLVDDHKIVRQGLRAILECNAEVHVVVESTTGKEGYRDYFRMHPDVIIIDIAMPGENGLTLLRRLLRRDPAAKALVLTMYEDELIAIKAMESGARGYLTKSALPETLVHAIKQIAQGEMFIEDRIAQKMAMHHMAQPKGLHALTPREFEVFQLLAEGKSVQEVAALLHVSIKTVGTHRSRVMEKLGCRNVAELARLAIRHGVMTP